MRSDLLLNRSDSAVLVVDIQEKLVPFILEKERMLARCRLVLRAAALLGVPVLMTEQYPKGLGRTVPEIAELVSAEPLEKLAFSSCGNPSVLIGLAERSVSKVVLIGMETHVCVQQTAMDLIAQGFAVYVVADAVGSRGAVDAEWGLRRMAAAGVTVTTAESVIFEWTASAEIPEFKKISQLIKEAQGDAR